MLLYLIKVPLFLVKVGSQSISSLHINHEILNFILQTLLGLFQRGTFGIHSFNGLLSILQTLSKFSPTSNSEILGITTTFQV